MPKIGQNIPEPPTSHLRKVPPNDLVADLDKKKKMSLHGRPTETQESAAYRINMQFLNM